MTNRIERDIWVKAPIERVWRALADSQEFGAWFRVTVGGPFVPGETARGHITHPGYEHLTWAARIERMDAPHDFAFTWHPYAVDPEKDYSAEPPTLVEFRLEPEGEGTRVRVTESGFDRIPAERRDEAIRMNSRGWTHRWTISRPMPRADAAPLFAALGDPTRLSLVIKLGRGEATSIATLSADTRLTRQAVTKHLRVLEKAGLVSNVRVGRERRFRLCPAPLAEASEWLAEIAGHWDNALLRLQAHVERED